MKKSAFTLIELLVVISIIAILASIAVPVFSKAVEKGKATNCAANLRQLGIGTVAYLNDNEDQMYSASLSWPIILHQKYVQNWKVFRSPFDKRPDLETDSAPVSYGVNQNLIDIHSSKFGSPSQLIMMAPSVGGGAELSFAGTGSSNPTVLPGNGSKSGTHNNRSQINVVYADAHAASISATEFSKASDVEGLKRWYPGGVAPE
jgi:prepilin-type N-terminal cleavage/methylation domain-containing protein/prepilin-type processing-associated H-X9-DG protein